MVDTKGEWECQEGEVVKDGIKYVTKEENQTSGGEHAIKYTDIEL